MSWGLQIGPCGVCDECNLQWRHKWWCKNNPRIRGFLRFVGKRDIEGLLDFLFHNTMQGVRDYWFKQQIRRLYMSRDDYHSHLTAWEDPDSNEQYDIDLFFTPLKGTGKDGKGFGRAIDKNWIPNKMQIYWRKIMKVGE